MILFVLRTAHESADFSPIGTPLPTPWIGTRERACPRDQAIGMPDIGHYSAGPAIARDHCLCSLLQHRAQHAKLSNSLFIGTSVVPYVYVNKPPNWARRREIPARP